MQKDGEGIWIIEGQGLAARAMVHMADHCGLRKMTETHLLVLATGESLVIR